MAQECECLVNMCESRFDGNTFIKRSNKNGWMNVCVLHCCLPQKIFLFSTNLAIDIFFLLQIEILHDGRKKNQVKTSWLFSDVFTGSNEVC